jgi:hypothetical protein
MKESLVLVREKLVKLMSIMKGFSEKYADMPCLGFTHCQPAQLTTVGKRCTLWMQDFFLDFGELDRLIADLPMRGVKGTTGTQATFLGNYLMHIYMVYFMQTHFNGLFYYCIYIDIHVCTHMYIDVHVYICIYLHMLMHENIKVYFFLCDFSRDKYTCMQVSDPLDIYLFSYAYVSVHR